MSKRIDLVNLNPPKSESVKRRHAGLHADPIIDRADSPLVYTQNNLPSATDKACRRAKITKLPSGNNRVIDQDTGEVLADDKEKTPKEKRAERYQLKAIVDSFLPRSRTSKCQKWKIPKHEITILKHEGKAFYAGLECCSNVWLCPHCSAKISERRREELKSGHQVAKSKSLKCVMLTLTAPHYKSDDLEQLLKGMTKALTRTFQNRSGQQFLQWFHIAGRIRAFEVTYSEKNGFHPHFHILLFLPENLQTLPNEIEDYIYPIWKNACLKSGLGEPSREHGVQVDETNEGVGNYIAKWGIESEMTKGHIKKSKSGYSMFDLLRAYQETKDPKFKKLFLIYAKAFKGMRQLVWSKGLKELLTVEDKSDEELATEKQEDATVFSTLTLEEWRAVYRSQSQAYILQVVEEKPEQYNVLITNLLRLWKRNKDDD